MAAAIRRIKGLTKVKWVKAPFSCSSWLEVVEEGAVVLELVVGLELSFVPL
jgi:hypothetical protein